MDANRFIGIQKLWGWKVATYLYLAGMGAGLYVIGFLLDVLHPENDFAFASELSLYAGAIVLIVAVLLIFSHLGTKANALRAFCSPGSSWLARGSLVMIILLFLDLVQIGRTDFQSILGWVTGLVALFVLVYTGMLLSSLKPFPFWHTWLLPFLFVFSGIGSGFMLLGLLIGLYGVFTDGAVMSSLKPVVSYIVFVTVGTALILGLFLGRASAVPSARDSFYMVTKGSRSMAFWIGVIVIGHVIPLGLGIYLLSRALHQPVLVFLSVILTLAGIIGGLLLKYLLLATAMSAKLDVAGDSVPLPESARFPASHRVQYR